MRRGRFYYRIFKNKKRSRLYSRDRLIFQPNWKLEKYSSNTHEAHFDQVSLKGINFVHKHAPPSINFLFVYKPRQEFIIISVGVKENK